MEENEIVAPETENPEKESETDEVKEAPKKPQNDKYEETKEARVARLKRQLKKAERELGVAEEEPEAKPTLKPFSLDRADKAFLNANGVRGKDEYDLVSDFAKNTGKELEDIIESKYFEAEIKNLRANRESKMASDAASGSNRTNSSPRDTVDYWIAKGELPPSHMKQLRRDVVNKKLEVSKNKSTFTDNPLIS